MMMADGPEGMEIVVKFAESYSREAHKMLATMTLAPKLLHYQKISGELHFVVMEHFDGRRMEESDMKKDMYTYRITTQDASYTPRQSFRIRGSTRAKYPNRRGGVGVCGL